MVERVAGSGGTNQGSCVTGLVGWLESNLWVLKGIDATLLEVRMIEKDELKCEDLELRTGCGIPGYSLFLE